MSAIAEIPQIDTYGMKCDTIPGNLSLTNFSQMVYQWRGKGDYTSQSPLALLCRRNLTDCEAGISIHGHSLGGLLANLAPQHVIGVSLSLFGVLEVDFRMAIITAAVCFQEAGSAATHTRWLAERPSPARRTPRLRRTWTEPGVGS